MTSMKRDRLVVPSEPMKTVNYRISAGVLSGVLLVTAGAQAQTAASQPESPYGGSTVEDIIARVNDQIISKSDYDRAVEELDQESQSKGSTMQEMSEQRKDLLRNLIDQQLWLSKGKELGITGDTDLVKRLDDIRKQYNMATIEDLEKAAKEQGVSFEDFKQNIRNQIITQDVMRQEVGAKIQFTPGEAQRYYDQHKQDYAQPESERLSEILVSTGDSADQAQGGRGQGQGRRYRSAAARGRRFCAAGATFSDGPTALRRRRPGRVQARRAGQGARRQDICSAGGPVDRSDSDAAGLGDSEGGAAHSRAAPAPYKDVEQQVEEAMYMGRMEPAIRAYLTTMREQAFIDIKPGYVDTGASPNETKPIFSAYVPPAPKKKAKVERTRYRENTRTFRSKSAGPASAAVVPAYSRQRPRSLRSPSRRV